MRLGPERVGPERDSPGRVRSERPDIASSSRRRAGRSPRASSPAGFQSRLHSRRPRPSSRRPRPSDSDRELPPIRRLSSRCGRPSRLDRGSRGGPPERRSKRGLMGFRSVISTGGRRSPADPVAAPGGLDCAKTASPPLSQIQWPAHRSLHRHCGDLDQHGFGRDAPNPSPHRQARARVVQGQGPEHPPSPQPQRHDEARRNAPAVGNAANAGATPKPHRRARRAAVGQAQQILTSALDLGSNRSSRELTERCGQIVHQVQKLFQTNQFHGLFHPGITSDHKSPLGVFALLGDLNEGTQA